jgi:hypothetical protein
MQGQSDSEASAVVRAAWDYTVHFHDVREFGQKEIEELKLRFGVCTIVLLGAGFPCQDYSALNLSRASTSGAQDSLVLQIPRVLELLRRTFSCPVPFLCENVASMDSAAVDEINQILNMIPIRVCSRGVARCRRPRLYWISWPVTETTGVSLQEGTRYHTAQIVGERIPSKLWLQKGWSLTSPSQTFLTFTRATPEYRPRHKRMGLDRVGDEDLLRWADEHYRFAPLPVYGSELRAAGTSPANP